MYRSNRLRLALGLEDFPGGHVHVSSVQFAEKNETEITDSNFEKELQGTVEQMVAVVRVAAGAVGSENTSSKDGEHEQYSPLSGIQNFY
jgi:hypothetical protein